MSAEYGTDPGISTINGNQIQIMAKAQFQSSCCLLGPRSYFYVLENSIETNKPMYTCAHTWCPSLICCNLPDMISKVYYDRGPWDTFCCLRAVGCVQGNPVFFGHNPKHVFCCMDCCQCYDDCVAGQFAWCCGDRVHYTPYESACCGCCPARATSCSNCFGLMGVKTGEPLFTLNLITGLLPGSGEQLVIAIDNARASWAARTGKK